MPPWYHKMTIYDFISQYSISDDMHILLLKLSEVEFRSLIYLCTKYSALTPCVKMTRKLMPHHTGKNLNLAGFLTGFVPVQLWGMSTRCSHARSLKNPIVGQGTAGRKQRRNAHQHDCLLWKRFHLRFYLASNCFVVTRNFKSRSRNLTGVFLYKGQTLKPSLCLKSFFCSHYQGYIQFYFLYDNPAYVSCISTSRVTSSKSYPIPFLKVKLQFCGYT